MLCKRHAGHLLTGCAQAAGFAAACRFSGSSAMTSAAFMPGQSGQGVSQVGEGIVSVAFAGLRDRVQHGRGAAARVASTEEIILASDCDSAKCAFGGVVVDVQ